MVHGVRAEDNAASPLSRQVSHFSIGQTSVLNALLWLGHDERICFGIEFSGPALRKDIQVAVDKTTVEEAIKNILGRSNAYHLSVLDGVIVIRKNGVKPPVWLDHKLRQSELPRLELMTASIGLWMRLESDLDPSIKGFGGDSPVTDPIDEVGPFRERGQTVRQVLLRIVASSHGASWFPTIDGAGVSFPASINRYWTLVSYSSPNVVRP